MKKTWRYPLPVHRFRGILRSLLIHRSTVVAIYPRSADLAIHRSTDSFVFRSTVLAIYHRCTDLAIYHRSTDLGIHRSLALLIHWSTDPPIYHRSIILEIYHRSNDLPQIHRFSDLLMIRWSTDPPIHQSIDLQIYWSIDLQTWVV